MSLLFRAHFHTRNRKKNNKNHFKSSFDYANAFIIRLNDSLLSFFHFILWDALARTQRKVWTKCCRYSYRRNMVSNYNNNRKSHKNFFCRKKLFKSCWRKAAKTRLLRKNAKTKFYLNKLMNYGFLIRCWGSFVYLWNCCI